MKQILSDQDHTRLEALTKDVEKTTNTQIVLAVIQRSDMYSELPWKAFAIGASFSSLIIYVLGLILDGWYPDITVLFAVVAILAGGAVSALFTLLIPGFARRFLSPSRAEVEIRQYAQSIFLSRELFATKNRSGILLLVSLFERRIVILPDTGLRDQLSKEDLEDIIKPMSQFLKQHQIIEAFETGLAQISKKLAGRISGKIENELSDEIIEEKGI